MLRSMPPRGMPTTLASGRAARMRGRDRIIARADSSGVHRRIACCVEAAEPGRVAVRATALRPIAPRYSNGCDSSFFHPPPAMRHFGTGNRAGDQSGSRSTAGCGKACATVRIGARTRADPAVVARAAVARPMRPSYCPSRRGSTLPRASRLGVAVEVARWIRLRVVTLPSYSEDPPTYCEALACGRPFVAQRSAASGVFDATSGCCS